MKFWTENVDRLLDFNNKPLLTGKGSIGRKQMEEKLREVYDEFDSRRKKAEALAADEDDLKQLEELEKRLLKDKGTTDERS